MSQEVKIDVSANTTGAAAQVTQVDQATAGLAKSLDQIAKMSKAAGDQVAPAKPAGGFPIRGAAVPP
jgi:hypothetical protein